MLKPSCGEIWLVNLNPTQGREQSGRRPALIVSVDPFNHGPAELVIVVPLTTVFKNIPLHIVVLSPEGGVKDTSYIKCEDVRSISKQRLVERWGIVAEETMCAVKDRLSILFGL